MIWYIRITIVWYKIIIHYGVICGAKLKSNYSVESFYVAAVSL